MNKVKMRIGYTNLVMDADAALKVFNLLNSGTLYEYQTDYVKNDEGKSVCVEKIKPCNDNVSVTGVTPEAYAMWKLAGEAT